MTQKHAKISHPVENIFLRENSINKINTMIYQFNTRNKDHVEVSKSSTLSSVRI